MSNRIFEPQNYAVFGYQRTVGASFAETEKIINRLWRYGRQVVRDIRTLFESEIE